MLVLGVTQVAATRVGPGAGDPDRRGRGPAVQSAARAAGVGGPAGASIDGLARGMRQLMLRDGRGRRQPHTGGARPPPGCTRPADSTTTSPRWTRPLRQAEDSLRLNPRVRQGLLHRVVLRTGLDTLEICAVVLRVIARTMTDLAKARTGEQLFPTAVAAEIRVLLDELADAVESFALLITTPVADSAEKAESRLAQALTDGRATRDLVAGLLLKELQKHPRQWQLHGALLTEVERILDELDVDKRTERLTDELTIRSVALGERHPLLAAMARRLKGTTEAVRERAEL